jgi:hypothetical protein
LVRPRRYSEKMQWRKLFDRNPLFPVFCDKLAVRGFIAARGGAAFLVPLRWAGELADLPDLAPPFVLKSSHGSGQVLLVRDRAIGRAELLAQVAPWLAQPYGAEMHEWGYAAVPRRLIAEEMITNAAGAPPLERRLFVFGGKVEVVNTVFVEDGAVRNGAFHTAGWERLHWYLSRRLDRAFDPPARLGDMVALAETLGAGLDHVRVDFYDCGASFYVGELTVYSWSGLTVFHPDAADFWLGERWRLAGK